MATEPSEERLDRSTILAYGNQASLAYYYHQLCVAFMPQEGRMGESEEGDEDESMDEDEDYKWYKESHFCQALSAPPGFLLSRTQE